MPIKKCAILFYLLTIGFVIHCLCRRRLSLHEKIHNSLWILLEGRLCFDREVSWQLYYFGAWKFCLLFDLLLGSFATKNLPKLIFEE